jgi:hypothetical protein
MALPDRTEEQSLRPMDSFDSGQVAENPTKKSKADEILQKIYSTNVPEPVFDQAKADRLQRMGRVNQIGKGISILGDMLATGLGANVKRRQDDGTAARLYQSYEQNLDKYKNDKDTYSLRKLSKSLDDAKLALSEDRHTSELDLRDKQIKAQQKRYEYENERETEKTRIENAKWAAELARKVAADKVDATYKTNTAETNRIKAEKETKPEKPEKYFIKVGNQGYEEGEARLLYDDAVQYYGEEGDYIAGMKGAYENQPVETMKKVIVRYLQDTKAPPSKNKYYNQQGSQIDKQITSPINLPIQEQPAKTQPKAQPAIDYTKIVY